jgi:hypothetical protein
VDELIFISRISSYTTRHPPSDRAPNFRLHPPPNQTFRKKIAVQSKLATLRETISGVRRGNVCRSSSTRLHAVGPEGPAPITARHEAKNNARAAAHHLLNERAACTVGATVSYALGINNRFGGRPCDTHPFPNPLAPRAPDKTRTLIRNARPCGRAATAAWPAARCASRSRPRYTC